MLNVAGGHYCSKCSYYHFSNHNNQMNIAENKLRSGLCPPCVFIRHNWYFLSDVIFQWQNNLLYTLITICTV